MSGVDAAAITWDLTGPYRRTSRSTHPGAARPIGLAERARIDGSFELMRALLDECTLTEALVLIADRALQLADARTAFIAMPDEQPDTLIVNVAVGDDAVNVHGLTVRATRSVLGRAYTSRRPIASRIAGGAGNSGLPAGPILMVPLDTGEATRGVLAVAGEPRDLSFSDPVGRQLLLFASSSATLIEIAEERRAGRPAAEAMDRLRVLPPAGQD